MACNKIGFKITNLRTFSEVKKGEGEGKKLGTWLEHKNKKTYNIQPPPHTHTNKPKSQHRTLPAWVAPLDDNGFRAFFIQNVDPASRLSLSESRSLAQENYMDSQQFSSISGSNLGQEGYESLFGVLEASFA